MYEAESSLSDPENEVSDNVEQNDEEKRIHSARKKCGDREMKDDPTKNVPKVSVISCTESNFQEKLNKGDDENCNLQSSKDDQSQQENLKLKELSVIGQNSGLSNKPESLLFPENESHVGKLERTYNEYIIPSEHHQHTFCITLYMYVMPFKVCIHLILITQTSFTQLQFSRKLHVLRQNICCLRYICVSCFTDNCKTMVKPNHTIAWENRRTFPWKIAFLEHVLAHLLLCICPHSKNENAETNHTINMLSF